MVSVVLMENGDVYTFGYGQHGQLGHGDVNSRYYNLFEDTVFFFLLSLFLSKYISLYLKWYLYHYFISCGPYIIGGSWFCGLVLLWG